MSGYRLSAAAPEEAARAVALIRGRVDWMDQVFDVDPAALAGCTLRGTFTAGGTVTGGDWEITFPAENN